MTKIKLYLIFLFLCSLVTQAQTAAWDGQPADKIANANGGTGEKDSPIKIASASELAYLAQQTNLGGEELTLENGESIKDKTNFAGVYFKLTEDIDLEEKPWTSIGISNNPFKGVLDGDNHKILNLASINVIDKNYAGLFGIIQNATIQNLHMEIVQAGLHVQGAENIGALAGYVVDSEITNCGVKGGDITGDNPMLAQLAVGGLTGQLENCNITDCSNTVNVKGIKLMASALLVGGITGANIQSIITNCHYSGSVNAIDERTDKKSSSYAGGITGASDLPAFGSSTKSSTISECTANVNITAGTHAGGIVGYFTDGNINNCIVEGIISTKETEGQAGGIIGRNLYGGSVTDCYNMASVVSSDAAGGIVGFEYSDALTISKCWSSGDITAPYAGGIAGFIGLGSIEECYTSGNITGNDPTECYAGGIAGYASSEAINNCSSTANVTAEKEGDTQTFAGGIIGLGSKYDVYQGTSIQNCYSTGKIDGNVEIKAEFSIRTYTINYDEPSKGTIRVTYSDNGSETEVPSGKSLDYGTNITIEAIPESGYRIESLKVNEETFSSGSSLLLTEDIFIEATFGKIPDPVPDYPDYPIYTYYTIKLPKVEGVTTNPSAGTYIYREGSDFSFTLTLDSAYNQSVPIVKLSDSTILEPDRWGYYTIWDIDRDWKICITEIKLNPDPVANETIKSGIDIKVLEDGLHIRLSQPGRIQIITSGGQILRRLQLPAGDNHIFSFPKGIYLIRHEGGKTVKVRI